MKKLISIFMCVAMLATMPMFVSAQTLDEATPSGNTTLSYTIDPTYSVTIPDVIEVNTSDVTITQIASTYNLASDQSLNVDVTGGMAVNGDITLTNTSNSASTLKTHLFYGTSTVINQANTLAANYGGGIANNVTDSSRVIKAAAVDTTNAQAGTYQGTIEFTISLS